MGKEKSRLNLPRLPLLKGVFRPNYYDYKLTDASRRLFPKAHPRGILVLGNQKSGTSAIAALLSIYSHESASLDIHDYTADEQLRFRQGPYPVQEFVSAHPRFFSARIIKEPALTFMYPQLRKVFPPRNQHLFIVRDPRDNIRSILDRIGQSGRNANVDNFENLLPAWQMIVRNNWLGLSPSCDIESLAMRWNLSCDTYCKHQGDFILVRFEDFLRDKLASIGNLAEECGFDRAGDISSHLDRPFQPRGNRNVTWLDFFGERNLEIIERTCARHMSRFGYAATT